MQRNFVECGLGALILSWLHCLNALLHIVSQIEQQLFSIFIFGHPFPLHAHGIIARVMMWRHAAQGKLHRSVA